MDDDYINEGASTGSNSHHFRKLPVTMEDEEFLGTTTTTDTLHPYEEEILAKLGSLVGRRLSALSSSNVPQKNHGDGDGESTAAESHAANDPFLKRLAMISSAAMSAATATSVTHTTTMDTTTPNGENHPIDASLHTAGDASTSSAGGLAQYYLSTADAHSNNRRLSSSASLGGESFGTGTVTSTKSGGQISVSNSLISSTKFNAIAAESPAIHPELVHSVNRMRDKLQQLLTELATEKSRRRNREKSLVKLAKELSKNRQFIQEQDETIENVSAVVMFVSFPLPAFVCLPAFLRPEATILTISLICC